MTDTQRTRVIRDGKVIHDETVEMSKPDVVEMAPSGLDDFAKHQPATADSCIYCGSADQLSDEHIIPYALGGKPKIKNGSCEVCRRKTHKFETNVLRGPMKAVRYIKGLPSRSGHADAPETIAISVTKGGVESEIAVAIDEAPILLSFHEFNLPTYLEQAPDERLQTYATATVSYGADWTALAKKLGASGLELTSTKNAPVAFGQMVAKIAYCFAWSTGFLGQIEDPTELPRTFLEEPNRLGRFVGSLPPPFQRYPELLHRISTKVNQTARIAFVEVQLFASSAAPTYVVVLGKLRSGSAP